MEKWSREEKMAYYFWLDDLILSHWGEYLDLKLDEESDDTVACNNKLALINYYQKILDEVGAEYTWKELHDWHCEKYGESPSFVRFCKDRYFF